MVIKLKESKEKNNIVWYFLIFSILGLIVEMSYCYVTTGVIESRKGLILGPFCPIYGVGAVILILCLKSYQYNIGKLFVIGAILGDIIEYFLSYLLEAIYGNRFWDYSYTNFHINGRISLEFTIFWGILSVLLIIVAKPWIDKIIGKIKPAIRKKIEVIFLAFLVVDVLITIWGVQTYTQRAYQKYKGTYVEETKTWKQQIESTLFSDEIMEAIFPNIRITDDNGNSIWASEAGKNVD